LNDKETLKAWKEYQEKHPELEYEEVDASQLYSVETFAPWFDTWISKASKKNARLRILLIWHSEFLTFACQQMLRRQLEERSFKNRVWFHIEDSTSLQQAIISRCITKKMPVFIHQPKYKQID
jgi:DNA polymerase III delta prime subunit